MCNALSEGNSRESSNLSSEGGRAAVGGEAKRILELICLSIKESRAIVVLGTSGRVPFVSLTDGAESDESGPCKPVVEGAARIIVRGLSSKSIK